MSNRLKTLFVLFGVLLGVFLVPALTVRRTRDRSEAISQRIAEAKTKTDNLRNAMRYLDRMTPLNRVQTGKEIQLELNTWIQTVDYSTAEYSAPRSLDSLPKEMLEFVGCRTPLELQFSMWDVDYLFERRMMQKLSSWIVDFPVRDSLVAPIIEKTKGSLSDEDGLRLEEAYKLFDWAMRNVSLQEGASSVTEKVANPEAAQVEDDHYGYAYLPWETLLFSFGDFIEKGRVFSALANQRGIETCWISVDGNLWAMGVLVGDELLVFEPKLALPVFDPDELTFATLEDAKSNPRILRRLDLPGRFDYAYDPGSITDVELLIDLPPTACSARMKMVEQSLLGDERMVLYHDADQSIANLEKATSDAKARVWQVPVMAQIHAAAVRERLKAVSDYTRAYMAKHGIWMMDNPAAKGRLKHLYGIFTNDLDRVGALTLYMSTRDFDEMSIDQLEFDPAVQKEMGVPRLAGEDPQRYMMRIRQTQMIFRRAKVDVAFLMAQLHFDRGRYESAATWFKKRVLENAQAAQWNSIASYGLARAYQELGEFEKASEMLIAQPSPLEAGNRLRLRYLRRMNEAGDSE